MTNVSGARSDGSDTSDPVVLIAHILCVEDVSCFSAREVRHGVGGALGRRCSHFGHQTIGGGNNMVEYAVGAFGLW